MKQNFFKRYQFLLLAIIALISSIAIETNYFDTSISERKIKAFQIVTGEKLELADNLCEQICSLPAPSKFSTYEQFRRRNKELLTSQNISFFVFNNKQLTYWSNTNVNPSYDFFKNSENLLLSSNAWYFINHKQIDQTDIFVLTFIKSQYPFKNDYIKNKFHPDFNINANVEVYDEPCENTFSIYDNNNKFLLSLSNTAKRDDNQSQCFLSLFLYFIGIIFLLAFMNSVILNIPSKRKQDLANLLFLIILVLIRQWMLKEQIPYIGYIGELFSSNNYYDSEFVPSLGDLIINVLILIYFTLQIKHRITDLPNITTKQKVVKASIFALVSSLYLGLSSKIFESLILKSSINFELFNFLNTNILSFIAYCIIALLLFTYFLFIESFFKTQYGDKKAIIIVVVFCIVFSTFNYLFGFSSRYFVCEIFYLLSIGLFAILAYLEINNNISKIFVLILSVLFIEIFIGHYNHIRKSKLQKAYAIELANEQDPIAESFLAKVFKATRNDRNLKNLMRQPIENDAVINSYLQKTYFNGFLKQYELECTVCGTTDEFESSNQLSNCEQYFKRTISTSGKSISDTNYYFINNQDGNITYFDSIQYNWSKNSITKLYIELHAEKTTQEFGYPEIFLDKETKENNFEQLFSSAKYKNRRLVSKRGSCPYALILEKADSSQFVTIKDIAHNYEHLAYRSSDQFTVVVSSKQLSWNDYIMWFPYIFMYFLLLSIIFNRIYYSKIEREYTLSSQIRKTIIGLLIGSFVVLGISYIYFTTARNDKQQRKFLENKMQSIAHEFSKTYKDYAQFSESDNNQIQAVLYNLANIYITDINFFDTKGNLIASSRPEVSQYKLTSDKMSPTSFYILLERNFLQFTHEESIGELRYLSTYIAISNSQNQILGYLNIPNFSDEQEFTQQFAGLIIGMMNLFVVLLLFATLISLFITKKISTPLVILQNKMKEISVGTDNKKIELKVPDEFAGLLENYNTMTDRLNISAKELAKAEREMAWSEMARQIAHEIKNPLTPMKLSIQLLNRSWDEKDSRFGERLKSISRTIIEQIDTLANTATSFSDFAKLSNVKLEEININELIQNCSLLFNQDENLTISTVLPQECLIVYSDKEKTVRLLNNILKNATQAIPKDKKGEITVTLSSDSNYALISITDNGQGISEESQKHIFELHFTTKSTGNGFGLAICKSIVESIKGSIWFETEINKGTTFFIKLPLYKQ